MVQTKITITELKGQGEGNSALALVHDTSLSQDVSTVWYLLVLQYAKFAQNWHIWTEDWTEGKTFRRAVGQTECKPIFRRGGEEYFRPFVQNCRGILSFL